MIPPSVLMCALAATGAQLAPAQQRPPSTLRDLSTAVETVAARVSPAVVQIRLTSSGPVAGGVGAASLLGTARSTGIPAGRGAVLLVGRQGQLRFVGVRLE
jgi:hypothetical protein